MYYGAIYANSDASFYTAQIWRNLGGVWSQLTLVNLKDLNAALNTGSGTLKFSASGTSLKLFWQPTGAASATLVATATDSALTSGSVGMRAGQGAAVSSFAAGGV
jgi:hypothetical protein